MQPKCDMAYHFGLATRRRKTETLIGCIDFDDRENSMTQNCDVVGYFGLAPRRRKTETLIGCINFDDRKK